MFLYKSKVRIIGYGRRTKVYAIFTMRKLQLTQRINQLQYRQMQLAQRLQDLAAYAANIADGVITPGEFMSSPASIFGVQQNYLNSSIPKALFQASMTTQMYMNNMMQMNAQSGGQYGMAVDPSNPNSINMNQFFIFNSFFRQALDAAGKAQQAQIKKMETEIQNEKLQIETQLKAAAAEMEGVTKAEEQGIKESAPKYA